MQTTVAIQDWNKFLPWYKRQLTVLTSTLEGVNIIIPPHLERATHMTRFGHIDYTNRKSYSNARKSRAIRSSREEDIILQQSEDNIAVSTV